jgi:hypothetical protein
MKKHSLLGNRFLISKYTRPLLDNAFANKHLLTETIEATIRELCFLLVRAKVLYNEDTSSQLKVSL